MSVSVYSASTLSTISGSPRRYPSYNDYKKSNKERLVVCCFNINNNEHINHITQHVIYKQQKQQSKHRQTKKRANSTKVTTQFSLHNLPIYIVSTTRGLKTAVDKLKKCKPTFIGIDCEWKPNFVKKAKENKVALLQIACAKMIILVKVHCFENVKRSFSSSGLLNILKNENIAKCGVGIRQDQTKLNKDHKICMKQCIDLNEFYLFTYSVDDDFKILSLKKMFMQVCEAKMQYKTKRIACSNWENDPLKEKQILYAADDAYAGFAIFKKLYQYHTDVTSIKDLAEGIDDFMYYEY